MVAGLLRRALGHADGQTVQTDEATGLPRVLVDDPIATKKGPGRKLRALLLLGTRS